MGTKNRIGIYSKSKKIRKINSFFLPCEFKPYTSLFKSTIGDFVYDVQPAFTYATMGIISYKPNVYSVLKLGGKNPIFGNLFTITNSDTILLLDKIKGFLGPGTVNYNIRWIHPVYTAPGEFTDAWIYVISDHILKNFESVEAVKDNGYWDFADEKLFDFMDKLSKS